MNTATKIPDETAISEIVTAPRAAKHLVAAGYGTLGVVREKGMQEILSLRYVGRVSIEEIKAAIGPQETKPDPAATPDDEPEFEEGTHPVHLERTPDGPSRLAWAPSNKVGQPGGGYRLQKPMWVEFDPRDGRATITQRMYWMRFFTRDESRVNEAIDREQPWRQACVEMVRRDFSGCGVGFVILSD